MKYLFIFVLAIILLFGCKKKEENYIVSGTITDPYQNKVISGVNVKLLAQKIESGMLNANFEEIESSFKR